MMATTHEIEKAFGRSKKPFKGFFFTPWVGLLLSTLSTVVSRPSSLAFLLVQIHWSRCLGKTRLR
jgi:hypothetical protein